MTKVKIVPVEREHIDLLAKQPSKVVLAELEQLAADRIWQEVERSSEVVTGFADGKLVCITGVTNSSILANSCVVWMLASARIDKHSFLFLRHGRIYLEGLRRKYSAVYCLCHSLGLAGDRWLHLLGFEKCGAVGTHYQYKLKGMEND